MAEINSVFSTLHTLREVRKVKVSLIELKLYNEEYKYSNPYMAKLQIDDSKPKTWFWEQLAYPVQLDELVKLIEKGVDGGQPYLYPFNYESGRGLIKEIRSYFFLDRLMERLKEKEKEG